jgi:dTDP-glucose 4,6-dehydratase
MKLFVTGGTGFIGSNFIRHVLSLSADFSVVNFDKLTYAGNLANLESIAQNSAYRFIKGDICDAIAVEVGMDTCDAVVHFAAESHVDRSIYQPAVAIETNLTGTFVLLEVARKLGIRRFLHVSTDEVYGDVAPGSCSEENSPLRPSSPYAASKAGADLLVGSFVRTYGFPAIITRSSNNYGPFQFPEKFLPLMITNALEDKPLPIYGDGRQEREWLHVDDNCRGILAALMRGRVGEVYNIGGLDVMENLSLARRLLTLLGKPESLLSFVRDRPGHDRRYAMTSRKTKNEVGWKPEISLDAGLRQTIDWYKNNVSWLAAVRGGDYRSYYDENYVNRDASLFALAGSTPHPSHS